MRDREGGLARSVARSCTGLSDDRELRSAVLEQLRRSIGFDAHAWLLTDPVSEVGSSPLADVPCADRLPALIGLKYRTSCNRWTALPTAVGLLHDDTGGHPERSELWRDLLSGLGVTDVASVVFRDGFGCWGFLDLWRIGGARFDRSEGQQLAAAAPIITTELRRCQAATTSTPPVPAAATGPDGPAVLVLAPDLSVIAQTPEADRHLRSLLPTGHDSRPIPAGAYNVAGQLTAIEAGVDDHPPTARVHLGGGRWATLGASRMDGPSGEPGNIAVTIGQTGPAERTDLFVRAHGLTPREVELVGHLCAGLDTAEVAERMHVSGHTVQDHLKSIFARTGVRTRRVLVARARGHEIGADGAAP